MFFLFLGTPLGIAVSVGLIALLIALSFFLRSSPSPRNPQHNLPLPQPEEPASPPDNIPPEIFAQLCAISAVLNMVALVLSILATAISILGLPFTLIMLGEAITVTGLLIFALTIGSSVFMWFFTIWGLKLRMQNRIDKAVLVQMLPPVIMLFSIWVLTHA